MRKAIAISTLIIALSAHAFGAMSDAVKMGAEKMNPGSAMRTVERIGDAGQTDTSFEMDPALSIRVASGAKIELDYTGTNEIGLGDFTGTATWSAEVSAPAASRVCLRLSTGGRVTHIKFAGRDLGVRAWAPFEWELPSDCAGRKGILEISVSTSVMPMYGDHSAGKWDSKPYHSVYGPDGPCGLLDAAWVLGANPIASEAHL